MKPSKRASRDALDLREHGESAHQEQEAYEHLDHLGGLFPVIDRIWSTRGSSLLRSGKIELVEHRVKDHSESLTILFRDFVG